MLQMHTEPISRGAGFVFPKLEQPSAGDPDITNSRLSFWKQEVPEYTTRHQPEQIRSCLPSEQLSDPTAPPSWVCQTVKTGTGPTHATSLSQGI
ncbi:hypothetical protein B0T18DRAFT_89097 [Schizothecium vesticola]|uniref:Uncharacterized protein n=1 Tax=Schizothecium vesticola TaxID=314040 RepID=A0AA40KAW8_9PEZI|nr:hypothetical protein B0T18DRAFT_89097 [Schizothecium vesticola]